MTPATIPQPEAKRLQEHLQAILEGKVTVDADTLEVLKLQGAIIQHKDAEITKRDDEICAILLGFAPLLDLVGLNDMIDDKPKEYTEKDLKKIEKIKITIGNDFKKRAAIQKKVAFLNDKYPVNPPRTFEAALQEEAETEYESEDGIDQLISFGGKIITDGRSIWKEIKKLTELTHFIPIFAQRYGDRLQRERDKQLFG